jgi:prepilin-type N-terminal cleavage/methylation domain-containing protein
MRNRRTTSAAFSLIEMLVVIAIIVVVAGLAVGLTTAATDRKNISRAQVERDRLVTLIENYKSKIGVYPPDNAQTPFDPGRNSLFYELAGAVRTTAPPYSPADPGYVTSFATISSFATVSKSQLQSAFGIDGVINASDDPTEIKRVLKDVKSDQRDSVAPNTLSFVVPIDWTSSPVRPNPWRYATGTNAVHNKDSFDLWVEIKVRGQTRIIGNWKE